MKNYSGRRGLVKNLQRLIVVSCLLMFSGTVSAGPLTLDQMPPWEVCVHSSQLALLLAQIRIIQNQEPKITPRRPPTQYEAKVINFIVKEVKRLIEVEKYYNPESIRLRIYNDCMKQIPL